MSSLRLPRLSSLRALRHRDFAFILAGATLSNIGTWMEVLALGVYVTKVTGRAEWTGGVAALTFLPAIVLSPLGGALADRFDRRRYVALGTALELLLAGTLATLAFTGRLTVPAIAVVSFLNGCVTSLFLPAFTALIVSAVPKDDLHSALSLDSAQYNLGRICGPALGAAVVTLVGVEWALLTNTLSFLAVLVGLAFARGATSTGTPPTGSLWTGIAEGMKVAREDPGIALALLGTLLVALCIAPFTALAPVMAIRVLNLDAGATSLLVGAQGTGALLAALAAGSLADRFGRGRLLEWCVLLIGLMAAAYWLSPSLPVAALAVLGLGSLYMLTNTGLATLCQTRVPAEMRARIASFSGMLLYAGFTFGVWLQGALADRLGVRLVTASAALSFFVLAVMLRSLRPRAFAVLET
ncbi:MFS transporter [Pyxidicoccus parkwayensis]|uniref:MFS transporter n=1 Tax=Pyxidicoccus parkwayensis TaxID=2813578 RepID=A0ABX7P4G6_9BACT|nr:MFS transporter [Pyxidicoccus parkwaysis]QSQ25385.1 MFS transporter [Pyxidicoccus parkwaysis]